MKKTIALLLILTLALLSVGAFAASGGQGDLIARNGELAAFMDGGGNIYVSGLDKPVNTTKAQNLLSIDPYRILFFARDGGALICLSLDGFGESVLTADAYAACLSMDAVYYISRANRRQVVSLDLDTGKSSVRFTAPESLEQIYAGQNGVVVTQVEGAGAYIQDAVSGQFMSYNGDIAADTAVFEDFELSLTDGHNLYIAPNGQPFSTLVDTGVQAWAVIRDSVYYISQSGNQSVLKAYNVSSGLWSSILTPSADMEMQLTASQSSLFMLSKGNAVYSVDIQNGALVPFATLPTPSSYALGDNLSIDHYRIEAVSGQLNIYGIVRDANTLPTFTFVDYATQFVADTSDTIMLLSAFSIAGESTVWNLLQPAAQYSTLRRGSRGEAVSAIQRPLFDLGYYDYAIDGIFGWRTERAVMLAQADQGLSVTGIADEALQRLILSGGLSAYDPYKTLQRGDRGLRVREMQERLRDLGFMASAADGIFGPRTERAVVLFRQQHELSESGSADSKTLRLLFSENADYCASYIDLQRGDSGYRVRELNRRLKELYYLEGSAGSSYTAATAEAVRQFQAEIGLAQTGRATAAVQKQLFSKNAPEYSGYLTLRRGDQNNRVREMQKRLQQLGYFDGDCSGYFGRVTEEAVKAFQRQIGLRATGVADADTLEELFDSNAPHFVEPTKIGKPVIDLSAFTAYADGIYQIADSATTEGCVTAAWYADGNVANYDISLIDDRNVVYTAHSNVDMNIASIPITSLDPDRTYTITVVAHPADSANDGDTAASLRFVRIAEPVEPAPGVVGELLILPEGSDIVREEGAYILPGETLRFKWSAEGDVSAYAYDVRDAEDNVLAESAGAQADCKSVTLSASLFADDQIYTLTVYAVPTNASMADARIESIAFRIRTKADPTPEPTAEPMIEPTEAPTVAPTEAPTETPTEEPTEAATEAPTEAPTEEPTEAPTEAPTEEPTEAPTEAPTEEPTEAPTVAPTEAPVLSAPEMRAEPNAGSVEMAVSSESDIETVVLLSDGMVQLSWATEGDVAGYSVRIVDAYGSDMVNQNLTNSSAAVDSAKLTPGMVYTMTATAYFNGTDATTSAKLCFMLPETTQAAEPEAESMEDGSQPDAASIPEEEPAYEAPAYEEPAYEEPAYEEPAYEEPAYEEPAYEEPAYEEPAYEEPAYEEPAYEEPAYEEPAYEEPAAEAEAEMALVQLDGDTISAVQNRLVEWGWLSDGDFSGGSLDDATCQAVVAFQKACNSYGYDVAITNGRTMDEAALDLLLHSDAYITP